MTRTAFLRTYHEQLRIAAAVWRVLQQHGYERVVMPRVERVGIVKWKSKEVTNG